MRKIGYARVSTSTQNLDRQIGAGLATTPSSPAPVAFGEQALPVLESLRVM